MEPVMHIGGGNLGIYTWAGTQRLSVARHCLSWDCHMATSQGTPSLFFSLPNAVKYHIYGTCAMVEPATDQESVELPKWEGPGTTLRGVKADIEFLDGGSEPVTPAERMAGGWLGFRSLDVAYCDSSAAARGPSRTPSSCHAPQTATAVGPERKDGRVARTSMCGVGSLVKIACPDRLASARLHRPRPGMGLQRQRSAMQCNSKWRYWENVGTQGADNAALAELGLPDWDPPPTEYSPLALPSKRTVADNCSGQLFQWLPPRKVEKRGKKDEFLPERSHRRHCTGMMYLQQAFDCPVDLPGGHIVNVEGAADEDLWANGKKCRCLSELLSGQTNGNGASRLRGGNIKDPADRGLGSIVNAVDSNLTAGTLLKISTPLNCPEPSPNGLLSMGGIKGSVTDELWLAELGPEQSREAIISGRLSVRSTLLAPNAATHGFWVVVKISGAGCLDNSSRECGRSRIAILPGQRRVCGVRTPILSAIMHKSRPIPKGSLLPSDQKPDMFDQAQAHDSIDKPWGTVRPAHRHPFISVAPVVSGVSSQWLSTILVGHYIVKNLRPQFLTEGTAIDFGGKPDCCPQLHGKSMIAGKLQATVKVVAQPIIWIECFAAKGPKAVPYQHESTRGEANNVSDRLTCPAGGSFSHGSNGVHAQRIEALADA
ncbi:hypothetical protein M747DRAFT_242705 [Aspergillus niger ATCC 13496]|uniref:Uncharacterized protein n=1 Tax=Aspergillus niger ATCC 13496 TaxID=1353008 RepID=A0A370BW24_ASPNG|nr:hypothetical protein M747DRAFT_242705 [Aspergillus niger ATCC 13496]